jgi:hypothetical protein
MAAGLQVFFSIQDFWHAYLVWSRRVLDRECRVWTLVLETKTICTQQIISFVIVRQVWNELPSLRNDFVFSHFAQVILSNHLGFRSII